MFNFGDRVFFDYNEFPAHRGKPPIYGTVVAGTGLCVQWDGETRFSRPSPEGVKLAGPEAIESWRL